VVEEILNARSEGSFENLAVNAPHVFPGESRLMDTQVVLDKLFQ
jgi:hypothetical protein